MFPKVLFVIVAAAGIGAGLLALRHQQLKLRNEMARLHTQMDQTRRETWDLQTRIATRASPHALREAIERSRLELEPVRPTDLDAGRSGAHAPPASPEAGQAMARGGAP